MFETVNCKLIVFTNSYLIPRVSGKKNIVLLIFCRNGCENIIYSSNLSCTAIITVQNYLLTNIHIYYIYCHNHYKLCK